MKIIGITGGTGAGKTTVLNALAALNTHIIDCDAVYHDLLSHSAAMRSELRERFGEGIFSPDGSVDRKALGRVVFNDVGALMDLNAITHKYINGEVDRQIAEARKEGRAAVAVDAIGLVEGGLKDKCDATVAVTAPTEVRVRRIMARENISEEYARMRVSAQKPDSYFREHCDYLFDNGGDDPDSCRRAATQLFTTILNDKK